MQVTHRLALIIVATALVVQAATPAPAIPNGSFSNGAVLPTSWTLSKDGKPDNVTAYRDSVVYRSAPAALRLESSPSGWTEGFVMCQLPVSLLRNKTFTVKGWTRKTAGKFVHVVVQPFYTNGTNTWDHQLTLVEYPDWKQWEFTYTFRDANTLSVATLNFFLDEVGTKAWIDDLEVTVSGSTTVRLPLQGGTRSRAGRGGPSPALQVLNLKGQATSLADVQRSVAGSAGWLRLDGRDNGAAIRQAWIQQ